MKKMAQNAQKWPNMPKKWPNLKYVPNFRTKWGHFWKNPEFQDNVPNSGYNGYTAAFD